MPNLFDDPQGEFAVLVNAEGQHSLWPWPIAVPEGWEVRLGPAGRDECLGYVDAHWTDMRPLSLVRALEGDADDGHP